MTYSFNVRAATKDLAVAAAAARFDEIAAQDSSQAPARSAVLASVKAAVRLLTDDDAHDVQVTVRGYLFSQPAEGGKRKVTNASLSASAGFAPRTPNTKEI